MPATVFPFPRLFGDLILGVDQMSVDGIEVPDVHIDREARVIAAHSFHKETWSELDVTVRVELPLQELRTREIDESRLAVLIRFNCDETNLRVTDLPKIEDGVARATLTVRREFVAEDASIEAFVVLDGNDGVPRILQEAIPWRIAFIRPRVREATSGKRRARVREFVQVRWLDFTSAEHSYPLLREFGSEAYFIDVSSSPPILYLNESIPGYRVLLSERRGASKAEIALRDLEYRRVALGVWLALSYQALSKLTRDADGELIFPEGWAKEVLSRVIREMFPLDPIELAFRKLAEMQMSDGQQGLLNGQLQASINRLVGASTTLRKHLTGMLEAA